MNNGHLDPESQARVTRLIGYLYRLGERSLSRLNDEMIAANGRLTLPHYKARWAELFDEEMTRMLESGEPPLQINKR